MFQVPVNNLERIRRARKKVKGILLDIGLESCRELLQEINSCGPGENCFSSTSWADFSLWESTGRRKKYRTKPFCCSLCNFSSKLPASLKNHLHRSHEEEIDQELVVPCPSCAFSSQSKTVVKHMRMFHTSVRKIPSAPVVGADQGQLKKEVVFTCLKCPFTDTLYYSMKKHVLVTHFGNIFGAYFGEKPENVSDINEYATFFDEQNSQLSNNYYCKKCHMATSTPDALVCHILTDAHHRDLEYELRSVISEIHWTPSRKTGSSKLIAPKSYARKNSVSAATVTSGVPMPNPACVQLVSYPQHNTNPLMMGQSTASLQHTVRPMPVVSTSPGVMLHTSPVSVMAQSRHGYLPSSIPVSQNMSLQSTLSQPFFVSPGFSMNQSVRTGVHPGNHAIPPGVLQTNQFSRPGMFSHQHIRPGFLPPNQSVHAEGLPINQSITSGGYPINHSVTPGLFTVNQSTRPGYFTPNQNIRPQAVPGAQSVASGASPANKYIAPGGCQDNNFMAGGSSLLRQLIPTGKQVNGIPTYTLGPAPVNLPASPGGAGTANPPQVPMQLTQSNTVAQISRSPASAPSPPVLNSSQHKPDQTPGLLPLLPLIEKNTKHWKTCPVCSELFPSNVYQVHMQVAHKQQGIVQNKEKDKVDSEKLAARAPFLRWVKEKVVRCLPCKCFVSEEELIKHLMMHGIVCLFCTWTFHDLISFVDHNTTVHNGKKKMHVDYIQRGLQLANDAYGNILFPHFDFNTKMPKEVLGEKEVHLAVLAGAHSKALVPVYIKVQPQVVDVVDTCVKQALKCPFCLSAFAGLEVYETHLKDRHQIMPTVHTILKTPAFKCIHCCGVYTGNMTLAAISVHLLRCRSAPKDSSSGIEFLTQSNGLDIEHMNGETHNLLTKRKSLDSSDVLAEDQMDKEEDQELAHVLSKRKKIEAMMESMHFPISDNDRQCLALDPKQYENELQEDPKQFLASYFHKRPYPMKREVEILSSLYYMRKIDVAAFFWEKQEECLEAIEGHKTRVLMGFNMSELKNMKHNLILERE